MAAVNKEIVIEQGSTFRLSLRLKVKSTGQPVDLTGATAKFQVRKRLDSSELDLDLSDTSGITLGGAAGTIDIEVGPDVTADMDPDIGSYGLRIVFAGGVARRLMEGKSTVVQSIVR